MLENRLLVDHILSLRGVTGADRQRLCSDEVAVNSLTAVITNSINPDPIDNALREYWASQKADDPSDKSDE